MNITATILDSSTEGASECFLCRISLEDYIAGLPTTYQDYDVQREIVSNVYLDHLVETVLQKGHIPPIVLVVENEHFKRDQNVLHIESFKILDGLQRTFRLQAISNTITYCLALNSDEKYLSWNKFKFSRYFSADLRALNSNTDVLRSVLQVFEATGAEGLRDTLRKNYQWFEVWTGLTPDQEVKKMLTLNAGHKPVKTRHQLELLFLNLLPMLRSDEDEGFQLVREKDLSSTQFSKNRENGHFHFAHIITALLSFFDGKPIATSTGLIQNIQSNDSILEEYNDSLTPDFLKNFVSFMVRLDHLLSSQYPEIGTAWMGREVSLAGLFGALGSTASSSNDRQRNMENFFALLSAHPGILNLTQFEKERNNLDLSKVNIGNVNRVAVFSAVNQLLNSPLKTVNWSEHFPRNEK